MAVSTNHFNPNSDPKLLCTCDNILCDKRSVKQDVLNMLECVRLDIDRPMIVTSGGRCKNHPNEIHRRTPADHQKGQGVDIAVSGGYQRAQLVKAGIDAGFNAIGVAKGFVHLGHRPNEPLVMWTY